MSTVRGGTRARSGRRSLVAGLMVLVLAVAIAPAVEAAPAASQPDGVASEATAAGRTIGPYRLMNDNSDQCLVVRGTAEWAPVVQTPCGYYRDQYWYFVERPEETTGTGPRWLLRNANSGKCLVVQGFAWENPASQVSCNSGFIDQVWWLQGGAVPRIGLYTDLKNANSGICLVVRGFVNGSRAVQSPCNIAYVDQFWTLLRD